MKKALSILLVDDEPMIVKSVARYLQMRNCRITACGDADDAIRLSENKVFDAVVADFNLPRRNGLELLRHFRAVAPHCRLIMTSGSAVLENVAKPTLAEAAISFLAKPFELEVLFHLLTGDGTRRA